MMTDDTLTPTSEQSAAPEPPKPEAVATTENAADVPTQLTDETQAAGAAEAVAEPDAAPEPTPAMTAEAPTEPSPEIAPTVAASHPEPEPAAEIAPTAAVAQAEVEPTPEIAPAAEATPEPAPVVASQPEPKPVQAAPTPEAKPAAANDDYLFEQAMADLGNIDTDSDPAFKRLSRGDRVEATVIQVEKDRVFVDLGTKSEGVVPLAELTDQNIDSAHGLVKVGDKINVVVIRPEGSEGNPIVSKKRADFEENWDRIERAFREGVMLTAPVVDRVKGGLVVDIGLRGFVPATHVGSGKLRNIERYLGETLDLKILEIDRERKKVVLSNRQAEEARRAAIKDEIFTKVQPSDILDGTVRRLTDYGAFIDLGGIDGLLHISEMSWMRINHPKEVLKEGQKIKVMVLRLDPSIGKISLGLRQVLPDPWNLIKQNYKIGQKLPVTIGRIVQSGAFIKLPEGAEAFLPISEMSNRRINKPQDVIEEGQEFEVTIIDLRPDERRMVLSLRGTPTYSEARSFDSSPGGYSGGGGGGYDDDDRRRGGPGGKKGKKKGRGGGRDRGDEDYDVGIVGRIPSGGATIGERLGMLKGFTFRSAELGDDDEPLDEETEAKAEETEATEPEKAADSEE
ncbi:MAG: Polyribonucleotide nucleotidyltransferase [Fimbriimonadaceae bacterium]|nr:Polyribonucleotide nucleotidyltransferase [Fimbriimonadaceae bacterium]